MTFISHIFFHSRLLARVLVALSMLGAILLLLIMPRQRDMERGAEDAIGPVVDSPAWMEAGDDIHPPFSVMRAMSSGRVGDTASFLQDFRFAGTFFQYESGNENASVRRGVLSYIPEKRQDIVSEGDIIAGATILHLHEDRITLEKDGESGTLYLGGDRGNDGREQRQSLMTDDAEDDVLQRTRFGEQTGEGFWTLDKKALMEYYEELLDEPERLLQVFDSLQPLYSPDGDAIEGYTLQAVGEQAFFDAVGFREGDVVRKVNSLPMTNRGRAEFFIRQVVDDRISAVVIDIERDGGTARLVYQLR